MRAGAELQRFERLYRQSADPWDYAASSYEQRRYADTLSALREPRHGLCLEVGCSIGLFTAQLAERCRHVVAIDFSLTALQLARRNLRGVPNVELLRAEFPEQTPPGSWDLITCSEVLYYLQEPALEEAIAWMAAQLEGGASVLAVSWRGGSGATEPASGDEVHARLAERLAAWHALDARTEGYRLDRFDAR